MSRAKQKRPDYAKRHNKVIFQHNTRSRVAKPVKKTLEALNWYPITHRILQILLLPVTTYFDRLMAYLSMGAAIPFLWRYQKWVDSWIASKDVSFFRHGILIIRKMGKVVSMNNILNDQFVTIFFTIKPYFYQKIP